MRKIILFFGIGCSTVLSCNNSGQQDQVVQATKTADSLKAEMTKQQTIDSMSTVNAQQQPQQSANTGTPAVITEHRTTEYRHHDNYNNNPNNSGNGNVGAATSATTNNTTTTTTTTTDETQKKGWSAKAKGAVIGAGAGAITGALLDSKKKGQAVQGGIIGGVVGAAAGLGAGAIIDKEKKNKENADEGK